ncbi:MAG: TetR/AcrR family transcriptional regulator [Streptomycetaceae bacterium]|nr:TetR/AcrR family transcriptional regulator [Streptomycetaceae bacterium]
MSTVQPAAEPASEATPARRRPRGAVRTGLIAAGVELARAGGPDAVVLREATRIVGVVPNAAYRHFGDRDELLAAVCTEAMARLGAEMAAEVARIPGDPADPEAALGRLGAIGTAYLRFARDEPGLFATAFAVPQRHPYTAPAEPGQEADLSPLGQLRNALDALVAAGALDPHRRPVLEFPISSAVHGLAVLTGPGPLREVDDAERARLEELTLGFIAKSLD